MYLLTLLLIIFTLQLSRGATIYFSYLGLAEGIDAIGNPYKTAVGAYEPGRLTFEVKPWSMTHHDITDFSFMASLPDTDIIGSPNTKVINFKDLLFFDANSIDGVFTNFTLIAESASFIPEDLSGHSIWADGQVFRFSVLPDHSARLEAIFTDSTMIVTEGTVLIIPEPNATALVAFGVALLGVRRRITVNA